MSRYYIGLDIGQVADYTALSVIEQVKINQRLENNTNNGGNGLTSTDGCNARRLIEYHVRHLERFPLGTPYPLQVRRVREIVDRLQNPILVIDQTGVGRPVFDMFNTTGLRPVGISIHGGDQVTREGRNYKVPKRDLVGALTVAFQNNQLKIADALPEAKILVEELLNFKVKINLKTAHDSYEGWREGIHDDLVLSVAMAVWYTSQQQLQCNCSFTVTPKRCNIIPTSDGLPSLPRNWRPFNS